MKKLVLFLSAIVVLASCQKKEYATFQKSSTTTYASVKKTTQAPVAVTAIEETATIAAPTEATLVADNSMEVASLTSETVQTPAVSESQVMTFNEQNINAEFEKLNKLEQYVTSHEGTTIEDVKGTELTEDLKLDTNVTNAVAVDELPLNIPAFWWGCVLGPIGVLAVYLITDKDKDQTKKALFGCLVTAAVYIVYYIVVVAVIGRSFWF
jgi:hypothetical protein